MRRRLAYLLLASCLGLFWIPAKSRGQAPPPPPDAPVKKNKYQKSKLTNDESEAIADKRFLLLSTGEDKAVDLDFEANAGANGISYGNPQLLTTTLVKAG